MNFFKTLGFLMVFVGYVMAGYSAIVSNPYTPKLPDEDELGDENDEFDTVRKPILGASDFVSMEPIDQTGSPKRLDLDYKTEDRKSNVHYDDQKTDGGLARVARSAGYAAMIHHYEIKRPGNNKPGGVISETFKSPGMYVKDKEEEEEDPYDS